MIKGSIREEDIGAPQYKRQMLTAVKGEINSNTIKGTLTPHLYQWTDHSRQKIEGETLALNDTLDQMDLIDISRAFHLKAAEYTFFSSSPGTFSRIDHMLGHKASLSKFKKTEIISSIFSNHNAMRLKVN